MDPTFVICACCGCEFGYEDAVPEGVASHRRRWIEAGHPWFSPGDKPSAWSVEEQLAHVPPLPPGIAARKP